MKNAKAIIWIVFFCWFLSDIASEEATEESQNFEKLKAPSGTDEQL